MYGSGTGSFPVVVTKAPIPVPSGLLTAGATVDVRIARAGECVALLFIPPVSGTYTLFSSGALDTKAYLFESDKMETIAADGDSDEDYNFSLPAELTAGVCYRYEVGFRNPTHTGTFSMTLMPDGEIISAITMPEEVPEEEPAGIPAEE